MKTLFLSCMLVSITFIANAQNGDVRTYQANSSAIKSQTDSVKLQIDGNNAYYQKTVRIDSGIKVSMIYLRSLQFMAAKNFTQNYGYEEEGKMIFTTTQDLNINPVIVNEDSDNIDPYTTQFAITIDMKNSRYRYTIHNVIFFIPTPNGNRRLTLYDLYEKATNRDSRRIAKEARSVINSFERYIGTLTSELYQDIENKAAIHDPKF